MTIKRFSLGSFFQILLIIVQEFHSIACWQLSLDLSRHVTGVGCQFTGLSWTLLSCVDQHVKIENKDKNGQKKNLKIWIGKRIHKVQELLQR